MIRRVPVQPTQVAEPWRTTLRTIIQTTIGVLLAAGVVVPVALEIIGEEFARWTSPEFVAVLGAISAFAVAVSATLTRIMAIPAVNAWLVKVNLGAGTGTLIDPDAAWRRPDDQPMIVYSDPEVLDPDDVGADGIPDIPRRAQE